MSARKKSTTSNWIDPDDAPELTRELAGRAQVAIGGKVVREATGTVTKRGRPPVGDESKQQVTLRLAPRVIRYFKGTGEGWQTRLNEALEQYVVRDAATGRLSQPKRAPGRAKRADKKV